ncbi:spore germination protein [Halalkalibacter akibai]|uniref:Spore germination protein GerYA n=1 Tax=Halalkalibacter akibai (strain ATCC 43226 / DSM 21942 / CIP 109018 / JCM 9157 / 1139) TaxID=1236973 RepID=W4QX28_HALA3|nr:spore germination protein [Halalkalibacter akibai]GAE35879.1 spore germination protein GerYA [Halalkalibacter akibai JCM 9157]
MLGKWLLKQFRDSRHETIDEVLAMFQQSSDFSVYPLKKESKTLYIGYYQTMIDSTRLNRDLIPYVTAGEEHSLETILPKIPIQNKEIITSTRLLREKVMHGSVVIFEGKHPKKCAVIDTALDSNRAVSQPEMEFTVTGPQEAFIESLETNINLIRKRLPLPNLQVKEMKIGKITQTRVSILYIDGIVDQDNLRTMEQRLAAIEFDQVIDSSSLAQMISDNSMSIFPQLINTERPERVAAVLAEGKVAFLADGSPDAIIGPTTLVEFFSSLEDYYLPWQIATSVRLLRFFAVLFSVLSTPIYVAVLTFHYELIPRDLLSTIIASRSNIPFPPILEAIFLELTIELLREAGARLPTKVGQTIGIVGGIVIGQASVEAGLTSNILLIIVALAALASFTTPVYQMGNTIRLIRFPFIITAAFLGGVGVAFCCLLTVVHLLNLTSLGRPYLEPLYPPRFTDWKDAFVRLPFSWMSSRPVYLRPKDKGRVNFTRAKMKHDIDE